MDAMRKDTTKDISRDEIMIVVTIMIILGFGFLIGSVRSDPLGVSVWWLGVYIGIALLIGAPVVTLSGVLP